MMKRIILALLVVCSMIAITTVTGCRRTIPTPNYQTMIVGKWTMKTALGHFVTSNGTRDETTNFKATDYFDFKADGTITILKMA